jgi:hypothetical protein
LFRLFAATTLAIMLFGGLLSQTEANTCNEWSCPPSEEPIYTGPGPTSPRDVPEPTESGYAVDTTLLSPILRNYVNTLNSMSNDQVISEWRAYSQKAANAGPGSALYKTYVLRASLAADVLWSRGCAQDSISGWVC